MIKHNHTPGPWMIEETYDSLWIGAGNSNTDKKVKNIVTRIEYYSDYKSKVLSERKANAKLIAAAPELLEALQSILELGRKDTSNPKYDEYYVNAKSVIKKALE